MAILKMNDSGNNKRHRSVSLVMLPRQFHLIHSPLQYINATDSPVKSAKLPLN